LLNSLDILDFKCIQKEHFNFKKLNLITGVNSSGKSTLLQSIMLISHYFGKKKFITENFKNFDQIRNKYTNAKFLEINLDNNIFKQDFVSPKPIVKKGSNYNITKDEDIFFLNSNRIGPVDIAPFRSDEFIGNSGEYIFSWYEQNKSEIISDELVCSSSKTLHSNVDYWLTKIADINLELKTEKTTADAVKILFKSDMLDNVSPLHLGVGLSYLAKIIIMCLLIPAGKTIIIENPELYLHPRSQSLLCEFFAFVASKGTQLIIETHCEHLINRLRYEIYKNKFSENDAVIYYKSSTQKKFEKILINKRGHLTDTDGTSRLFPAGFFDINLEQLIEIG
jgi:predicted ATPase